MFTHKDRRNASQAPGFLPQPHKLQRFHRAAVKCAFGRTNWLFSLNFLPNCTKKKKKRRGGGGTGKHLWRSLKSKLRHNSTGERKKSEQGNKNKKKTFSDKIFFFFRLSKINIVHVTGSSSTVSCIYIRKGEDPDISCCSFRYMFCFCHPWTPQECMHTVLHIRKYTHTSFFPLERL